MSDQNNGFEAVSFADMASVGTGNIASGAPQSVSLGLIDPDYFAAVDFSQFDPVELEELLNQPFPTDETATTFVTSSASIGDVEATPGLLASSNIYQDDISALLNDFDTPVSPKAQASVAALEEGPNVVNAVDDVGSWTQAEPAGAISHPASYSVSNMLDTGRRGLGTQVPQGGHVPDQWLLQQPVSLGYRYEPPASELDFSDLQVGPETIPGGFPLWNHDNEIPFPQVDPFRQLRNHTVDCSNGYQFTAVPLQGAEQTAGRTENARRSPEQVSDSDISEDEYTHPSTYAPGHSQANTLIREPMLKSRNRSAPAELTVQPSNKSLQLTRPNTNYTPHDSYQPLRRAPRSWGRFKYTKNGELEPSDLFTAEEIDYYLFEHPLHQQSQSKRKSNLILRIHRNPPESANRFPTVHGSHRCRFRDCTAHNNTINQGHYAVILDELSVDHPNHDPFLNAGWVHLYCLERFCDFPWICEHLNVQSEKRDFPHESSKHNKGNNRMRLDKIGGVEKAVEDFVKSCRDGTLPASYPRLGSRDDNGEPYEGTLCHKMNVKKQRGQPSAVTRQEAAREQAAGRKGGTLSNHLGNLAVECPIRHSTRKHDNQNQLIANPRHHRTYKRGISEVEREDETGGEGERGADEDEHMEPRARKRRYVSPAANVPPAVPQHWQRSQKLVAPTAHMMPAAPQKQLQPQESAEDPQLAFTGTMPSLGPQYQTDIPRALETQPAQMYPAPIAAMYNPNPAPQGKERTSAEANIWDISTYVPSPYCSPNSSERQLKRRRATPAPYDDVSIQASMPAAEDLPYIDSLMPAATRFTSIPPFPAAPERVATPTPGCIKGLGSPSGLLAQCREDRKRRREQSDSKFDNDFVGTSSSKRHRIETPVDNSCIHSDGSFVQRYQHQLRAQQQQSRRSIPHNSVAPRAPMVHVPPANTWDQYQYQYQYQDNMVNASMAPQQVADPAALWNQHQYPYPYQYQHSEKISYVPPPAVAPWDQAQYPIYNTLDPQLPLAQPTPVRPFIPNTPSIAGQKRKSPEMQSGRSKRTPDPRDAARGRVIDQHAEESWCSGI